MSTMKNPQKESPSKIVKLDNALKLVIFFSQYMLGRMNHSVICFWLSVRFSQCLLNILKFLPNENILLASTLLSAYCLEASVHIVADSKNSPCITCAEAT